MLAAIRARALIDQEKFREILILSKKKSFSLQEAFTLIWGKKGGL
jgi:hypothetical protein